MGGRLGAIRRDAADKWFSDCIRHKAGYSCERCGKSFGGLSRGLECAHIYGRANKSTRWCADNALSLCTSCHFEFTAHPLDFSAFVSSYLGTGKLELLLEKKNTIFKTNARVRREIATHYREEYRRMLENDCTDLESYQ